MTLGDRWLAAGHLGEKQDRLLDVQCQVQQVHNLGHSRLGHLADTAALRSIGDETLADKSIMWTLSEIHG